MRSRLGLLGAIALVGCIYENLSLFYMKGTYFLDFFCAFDPISGWNQGILILRKIEERPARFFEKSNERGKTLKTWPINYFEPEEKTSIDIHKAGGIIPPEYRCNSLQSGEGDGSWNSYEISTTPTIFSDPGEVKSNFYKIEPSFVTTDKNKQRNDFGIRKGKAIWSKGHITLSPERFCNFEKNMAFLKKLGVRSIPVYVTVCWC